jgi:hypothetical protein
MKRSAPKNSSTSFSRGGCPASRPKHSLRQMGEPCCRPQKNPMATPLTPSGRLRSAAPGLWPQAPVSAALLKTFLIPATPSPLIGPRRTSPGYCRAWPAVRLTCRLPWPVHLSVASKCTWAWLGPPEGPIPSPTPISSWLVGIA